jgi:hypothetical protein
MSIVGRGPVEDVGLAEGVVVAESAAVADGDTLGTDPCGGAFTVCESVVAASAMVAADGEVLVSGGSVMLSVELGVPTVITGIDVDVAGPVSTLVFGCSTSAQTKTAAPPTRTARPKTSPTHE